MERRRPATAKQYTWAVPTNFDLDALLAIGWPDDEQARLTLAQDGGTVARVITHHRDAYDVARGPDDTLRVRAPPAWSKPRFDPEARACVGDWVRLNAAETEVVELLPRRSLLKRAAAGEHYKSQPIAANIDTVLIVCGLDGDFNPRRIERYLTLIGGSGVTPVLVLTKRDMTPDVDSALDRLAEIAAAGVAVLPVNAKDPDSLNVLHRYLGPGRTVVLVGSSGAGKSTLTNSLLGVEKMRTGEVRASDARGRHTTTRRVLMPLPQGGCLIDTPGMRELKLTGEERIDDSFEDIAAIAGECRFRDCQHQREPGCALRAAEADGRIDPQRLANYLKLHDESAQASQQVAARLVKKSDERVLTRALNKRLKEKYDER